MNHKVDVEALQEFLSAAKTHAIIACVNTIESAVKTDQPEIRKLAFVAYRQYSYLQILEEFFVDLGCKTRNKSCSMRRPYDDITYGQMLQFLDDATNDIIDQKGITLE